MNYELLLKDRIRHAKDTELDRLKRLCPNNARLVTEVRQEQAKRKNRPKPANPSGL
jgi:hypothetical protein